jgi:hypothetical protein
MAFVRPIGDGSDVHDDDPPEETAELCYSAADHLIRSRSQGRSGNAPSDCNLAVRL